MKKVLSFVIVLAMLMSTAVLFSGCGGEAGKAGGAAGQGGGATFKVFGYSYGGAPEKKDVFLKYQEKWAAKAKEVANAEIDWMDGDIEMLMSSGQFPDIILKTAFQNVDVARYADQGILIDLAPYINEKDTPNIWEMFTKHPTTKAIATSPDGGIYALPSYSGNPGSFIETFWYINTEWLNKLGLQKPTNLDELYTVLKAFKEKDPNGNGKPDEIPMTFKNDGAYNYPESLLSAWGVSTKFGMYDAYLNVQNGKVNFAPVMDEWKEMIKFYAKLYSEGLLDKQCFTYDQPTWSATLKSETPVVGVMFGKENPFGDNADQYEVILPLKATKDSPDPLMHIHPGVIGTRNACHVTTNCTDPAAALKWIDTFYDEEMTIQNWYGEAGTGKNDTFTKKGDVYTWRDPAELGYDSLAEMYGYNTTYGPHMVGYWDSDIRRGAAKADGTFEEGVLIEDCEAFNQYDTLYDMYEPYMDLENSWPRPYYNPEDASELSNLQTDIFNCVEQHKADWIMGRSNVDADWEKYKAELKKLSVDKFIKINQDAYDVYNESLKSMK